MCAGKDAQSDDIDALLNSGPHNGIDGLPDPRVDHFHASILQSPGYDFGPLIVPIQPGFRNQNSDSSSG